MISSGRLSISEITIKTNKRQSIKATVDQFNTQMDHLDRSLDSFYFDLLQTQMSESQDMWGSQSQLYKPNSQPASTCSTPSTPPYSMSLDLERKMIEPVGPSSCKMIQPGSMLITDGSNRQPVALIPPPLIATTMTPGMNVGSKRRNDYVDPCAIAPLKKRKIQVDLLAPDEKEKVLQKREKNKAAAERCRVKRRENIQKTRAEYEDNYEINEALQADILKLKEERRMLQELLNNHRCVLKMHA